MSSIEISSGTVCYGECGPANGRPVVFVHGYMMGGQVWHGFTLASGGYTSVLAAPQCPARRRGEALV
jgi:pimeloyl-ACP methyl ester carboxylesterase